MHITFINTIYNTIWKAAVVRTLGSHTRDYGFKSCLAQDNDYWWGKVTEPISINMLQKNTIWI